MGGRRNEEVVVALVQGGPRTERLSVNQSANLELIDKAAKTKPGFIVFDELSTTPYFPVARERKRDCLEWAEMIPGPYTNLVGRKAQRYGCYIIAPMFEKARGEKHY